MAKALRILIVAVVLTLALGAIIGDRAYTLKTGQEVILRTAPVDPRDFFRGDYVELNYDISRLRLSTLAGDDSFAAHEKVFVVLKKGTAAFEPIAVHRRLPKIATNDADIAVLAGRIDTLASAPAGPDNTCSAPCQDIWVSYGIESYFVPENTGHTLEKAERDGRVNVIVAVRRNGRATIKALEVDGKRFADEGLL